MSLGQAVVKGPKVERVLFGTDVVVEQGATQVEEIVDRLVSEMFQREKELLAGQLVHLLRPREIAEEKNFVGIRFERQIRAQTQNSLHRQTGVAAIGVMFEEGFATLVARRRRRRCSSVDRRKAAGDLRQKFGNLVQR